MTALEPLPPEEPSRKPDSRIRSSSSEPESDWTLVKHGSIFFLLGSGLLAFQFDLDTIPKLMFFIVTLSIGLGGFASMLSGKATLTLGKWFKATGMLAVFFFIFLIVMKSAGLLPRSIRSILSFDNPAMSVASAAPKADTKTAFILP